MTLSPTPVATTDSPHRPPLSYATFRVMDRLDEVCDVQGRANGFTSAEREGRRTLIARRAAEPGLRAVGAFRGRRLAGFAYGAPLNADWWWAGEALDALGSTAELASLGRPFTLLELHVIPSLQRRGVGGTLARQLCRTADPAFVLLTCRASDPGLQHFYRTLGFTTLPGARVGGHAYHVMTAPLPLRRRTSAFRA
ncbi:GNAT family N-acetyltransferase [Kitasatospora mediocidica]|uniref:GNAT family N-acetyltransferase n=1 Tax=Kitasatospora mediocidica TaxID=58352 RepID=UPI00056D5E16|nr:GNAT family N-acetyltransferase [Kitasatospora mediocidica]